MGFLHIFQGKERDIVVSDLTVSQKQDIIAMREDGMLPSEIAQELGINPEKVSKLIELEKRKLVRQQGKGSPVMPTQEDPVARARQDLEAAKLQLQLDQLKFEREQLQAEKREYWQSQQPVIEEGSDDPLMQLASALIQGYMTGKQGQQQLPQYGIQNPIQPVFTQPTALQADSATIAVQQDAGVPPQRIDLNDEQINEILERYKKQLKPIQKLSDETLLKLIQGHFPQFSDATHTRAIELLKKKELK